MNSYSVLWFLVLIHSFSNIMAQSGSGKGNSQLFLGQYPIPKKTSAPINIETDKVKNAQLSPLIFTAVLGANAKVINNGFSVEAILDQATPGATVRGGPLRNDIYIFHVTEYFWAGNSSGPAGTLINGTDGVPIEAVAFWYNQKYGSFDNSKNYRDGMAAIAFPVKIDPLPNLAFIPFSEKVEKVRKPGSNVTTNLAETFIWFDGYIIPNTPYFSYPGSYRDQKHSKEYYCATVIIFRPQINFISEKQFENSFLKLKDSKGNQLINAVPPQPQGDIPVIQAEGQLQIFFPVGKQLLDCSTPNKIFGNKYAMQPEQIQEVNSTIKTTLGTAIAWFVGNGILSKYTYYAYPESYNYLPHSSEWCLSKEQYAQTFGSFMKIAGQPLMDTESLFPATMPVVHAKGIIIETI